MRKRSNKPSKRNEQAVQIYRGPVTIPSSMNAGHIVKVNETYATAATTSGAGVIDLVFGNSPAVFNQWSTWASLYHEYRVLAIELEYLPIKNVSSWAYGIGISVADRQTSATLGSITAAINHESAQKHQMFQNFKRTVRMLGTPDANWVPTASPAATNYIKVYSFNNATIQTIGYFFLKFLIEFKTNA